MDAVKFAALFIIFKSNQLQENFNVEDKKW